MAVNKGLLREKEDYQKLIKDTAGPSFNNVITVSCTVAIVFIGVTTAFSLM